MTLFLVLAIPTVALVILIATYVRKDLQAQAIEHNSLTARLVAQSVQDEFEALQRSVESFSRRAKLIEFIEQKDANIISGKLHEMLYVNPKFARAFVTDSGGTLLADFPRRPELMGKNFSERDWYKGALKTTNFAYISEIYQRTNMDNASAFTVCFRIQNSKKEHIGYLGGQVLVDKLAAWLQAIKPSPDGLIELFDQNGTPALPNQIEHPEAHRFSDIHKELPGPEGWKRIQDPLTAQESIVTYVRVPFFNWTVVARQPLSQVFAPIEVLLRTIVIFFLVCLAGTFVIGYVLFDTLSKHNDRRRLFEDALEKQASELKRSNEELEGMCYSIAHDLRAPLRAMRGFTSALIEDYNPKLDQAGKNYTKRIDESAGRMDELIQDLLDYGKLGHVALPTETVSLQGLVQEIVDSLSEEITSTGGCLDIQKSLPTVLANRTILQQVITNLLSNSLKFVALGITPQVKIGAEIRDNKVRISIRDNGIGIDPAHHKRIFGVFERLHSYESYPGTGIGLAIVRKGVERMGGVVGLESNPDKGSCFWFELPKA